jgi:hypothetical protein
VAEGSVPFNPDQMMHQLAQGIAQLRELLAPIDEAAAGYRKHLEEEGWSPTIAEHMAFEFHRTLMGQAMGGKS